MKVEAFGRKLEQSFKEDLETSTTKLMLNILSIAISMNAQLPWKT